MSYLLDSADEFCPTKPLVWRFNQWVSSTTIGKTGIHFDSQSPEIIKITVRYRQYSINLYVLDQNQGIDPLRRFLGDDQVLLEDVLEKVRQVRERFNCTIRYSRIELVPPTFFSATPYRILLTLRDGAKADAYGNEINVRMLEGNQVELTTCSYEAMCSVLHRFRFLNAFQDDAAYAYADRFSKTNALIPLFDRLENTGTPLIHLTVDERHQQGRWFTANLDQMTSKEFLQYLRALLQHPRLIFTERRSQFLGHESASSPRARITLDYLEKCYRPRPSSFSRYNDWYFGTQRRYLTASFDPLMNVIDSNYPLVVKAPLELLLPGYCMTHLILTLGLYAATLPLVVPYVVLFAQLNEITIADRKMRHPIFKAFPPVTALTKVSTLFRATVNHVMNVPVDEMQAKTCEVQNTSLLNSGSSQNNTFHFFGILQRDLQQKVITHALESELTRLEL